ncbi:MAG: CHAT domain-containing protein [Crocosphaera sp.]
MFQIYEKTANIAHNESGLVFLSLSLTIIPTQLTAEVSKTDNINSTSLDLLVLSACETATGGDRSVLGLAGVAVKAGVRSTLATLWPVLDNTTADFMASFYEKLQQPNMTKIKAVQLTQQEMLKDPSNQRPNIWSAYTLVGNWL